MPRLSREHEMKLHNFDIDFFNTELKYYYADFTLCILAKPHCLDIENVFKIGSSTESEANYNIAGICEFALINLEKYYNTKDEKYLNLFLSNIKWLESNAVINSETAYWYYTYEMGEYSGNKWASSISQGMAASVMTRAYVLLKEEKYLDLAIKAVNTILTPVHQGGFKYSYDTFKCFYEESGTNSHILNGHVYGNPCNMEHIKEIADIYGLKVIYDAAHAFGVKINGKSILEAGDMATLSFHATKTYNTIEGGALVCRDAETKKRIDYLKNFGFAGETTVIAPGINGKMDEVRAAYGLLQLKHVNKAISQRQRVAKKYRKELRSVKGISFMEDISGVRHNYSYFPIFVDEIAYGMTRDELYFKLREKNIFGRRYFYPLISEFATYRGLPSARKENLPNAHKLADSVICLPMYHELQTEDIDRVIELIKTK